MKCLKAHPEEYSLYSKEALEKGLYVPGRMAQDYFLRPEGIVSLSILKDEELVGWAMIYNDTKVHRNRVLGVFLREDYRGKKLSPALVKLCMEGQDSCMYSIEYDTYFRKVIDG